MCGFLEEGAKFWRALCFFYEPHVLQMLASKAFEPPIGGAAEGEFTALCGEDSSRTCGYSQSRGQNSCALQVSFESLMFSICLRTKHLGLPRGSGGGRYHSSPWGKFESYSWVFHEQGSKFQSPPCLCSDPHVLQMLASKAVGPPV